MTDPLFALKIDLCSIDRNALPSALIRGHTHAELLQTAQDEEKPVRDRWAALAELSAQLEFLCSFCSDERKKALTEAL